MQGWRAAAALLVALVAPAQAQVCGAPGRDAPGSISGVINRYHAGVGTLAAGATSLTLGAASGAATAVQPGDLLLVIQMQGASIDASNDQRYGDGTGPSGTATTSISQASGYTALGQAGLYEYVRVVAVGATVDFTPPLANSYVQNTTAQPRRTYQVVRVPQYPSASIGAAAVTALPWDGSVGGIAALDVAGRLDASGAGPHIDVSNLGFRGGGNYADSGSNYGEAGSRVANGSGNGGIKGEGIAGTPRYVQASTQGTFSNGTQSKPGAYQGPSTVTDLGAGHMGYPSGAGANDHDGGRGAPGNAGGGGNAHNAAGGGGGNGGAGGSGGQTYNGDGLADRGGYGGAATPQAGGPVAGRIFLGGGGGAGGINNASAGYATGGRGGGIILLRAGTIGGAAVLRANGQRGFDPNASNDPAGGGGAGGSVVLQAGAGHGSVSVQARGGNGGDSNFNDGPAPYMGDGSNCCGDEREGPGGGGGGGVVVSNAPVGSADLSGGANGISDEDLDMGFSGNLLSFPGAAGAAVPSLAAASVPGVRPGYDCKPVLTVNKTTSTPLRTVPPDTTAQYSIQVSNASLGSGVAYGVALGDVLSAPFTLTGTVATLAYGGGATGPASPLPVTGSTSLGLGTAGHPTQAFTLPPGGALTATFLVSLNAATSGTYQNPATVLMTDPTRTSGGSAAGTTNPAVGPGGAFASGGGTAGGSNYAPGSSTAEDIVVSGASGSSADLALTKSGPASAEVGEPVVYVLTVSNLGPSALAGSVTIADTVPAAIGTVTWVCALEAGSGDCNATLGGTGAAGSGNAVVLANAALASGAQLQLTISGTAATSGSITNTATVSLPAGFTDPVPGNNSATATTSIAAPSADLSVSKTNGVAGVIAGGATDYTIVVANAGPSAAHNALLVDPATTGLAKVSVTCSAAGGAVCPGSLGTGTLEAGIALPTLPAGSTLTLSLDVQVTAGTGTVTNTVSVNAPAGLADPNLANNSASDADPVAAASAQVVSAPAICPAGTTEQLTSLLANGAFTDTSATVGASVPQYPLNTNNPPDTSVAPQSGNRTPNNNLNQRVFPGDPARSVAAANNFLYSNGNNTGAAFRVWRQAVSGLVQGRTYAFMLYGSNARNIGSGTANPPIIQQRVVAGTTTYALAAGVTYPNHPAGSSDTWTLQQSTFTATETAVLLDLWDTQTAGGGTGDNWAVTQIILRECRPNPDPAVTKTNGTNTVVTFGTTAYVLTVGNNGPGPADNVVVRDPAAAGLSKTGVACTATGSGAACPLSVTLGGLEGAGLTIPTLPVGTTVAFTVSATVTALNGTVTNSVQLSLPSGVVDANPGNNGASDADAVRGLASLTVAKSNGAGTVSAGGTTAYTVTVANLGPSSADGAVVQDAPVPGLACATPVVCTATGGASCGGPSPFNVPLATLQGAGLAIPALPSGGVVTLRLSCTVTASGS